MSQMNFNMGFNSYWTCLESLSKSLISAGFVQSRFSTSEYFSAKRLFSFVIELSAETKWN